MNTHRGRRVETEWGATYVPVDPKTELPEYIVDAAYFSMLVPRTSTRERGSQLRHLGTPSFRAINALKLR